MTSFRRKYRGHTVEMWEKSFSVDDGPVFMLGSNGLDQVYRLIDDIEAETKKQIRLLLGVR